MKLSTSDYKKILKFYKLSVPKNKKSIEKKANKIIADKFCSCIKKVQQKFREEGIAIGICTNSVINRKGYKRGNFKCKKRRTINLHKGGKRRKKKTRKKRGKGATISRFFVEPDYTWNAEPAPLWQEPGQSGGMNQADPTCRNFGVGLGSTIEMDKNSWNTHLDICPDMIYKIYLYNNYNPSSGVTFFSEIKRSAYNPENTYSADALYPDAGVIGGLVYRVLEFQYEDLDEILDDDTYYLVSGPDGHESLAGAYMEVMMRNDEEVWERNIKFKRSEFAEPEMVGGKRKKKTRKKRGKGATISRFFEPDYTWNAEQFDGNSYNFGAAGMALESYMAEATAAYMNEYGSQPDTREYQRYQLQEQRGIIDDFHNSIDRSGWQGHLDRARQAMFQQMGNEPQLPQARTEADFLDLIQNPYSGNESPGAAGGGKRKKKTRRKKGGVKTPRTSEMPPKNAHQPMPVLTLPPSAISSLNAEAGPETIEEIFRDNMRQQLVGIDDPYAILQILSSYQIDYNSRIDDGLVQNGDFGERLNQDVTNFQNYIGSLQ